MHCRSEPIQHVQHGAPICVSCYVAPAVRPTLIRAAQTLPDGIVTHTGGYECTHCNLGRDRASCVRNEGPTAVSARWERLLIPRDRNKCPTVFWISAPARASRIESVYTANDENDADVQFINWRKRDNYYCRVVIACGMFNFPYARARGTTANLRSYSIVITFFDSFRIGFLQIRSCHIPSQLFAT